MSTIAAISTPSGSGAIALVRVSGPEAFSIADKVFVTNGQSAVGRQQSSDRVESFQPWTIHFGRIADGDEIIDEVLLTIFKAPHSYTGEDLVEISCHGSVYIQQAILQLLIREGAEMARPGEFTQRAYLNGKMDLTQAEAVSDLIASSSKAAQQVAMDQMRGGFSREIQLLRLQLLEFVSLVELELDFSEEDVEFADRSQLRNLVYDINDRLGKLTDSFQLGNAIKEGIPVAIVGETNVGKSTLLNALLQEDKAIVSHIPGTTRDFIEDRIQIQGVLFRFIDTAGLRHTEDHIENIGIERSYQQIEKARIVLLVTDPTAPEEQSLRWVKSVSEKIREDQQLIIIVNKGDLGEIAKSRQLAVGSRQSSVGSLQSKNTPPPGPPGSSPGQALLRSHSSREGGAIDPSPVTRHLSPIIISAKTGMGLDELESTLLHTVNLKPLENHDVIITNVRHYEVLVRAKRGLGRVIGGLETRVSGDFLSQDIREVLHHLGEITGQISTDEVLGEIFSRFCIGK